MARFKSRDIYIAIACMIFVGLSAVGMSIFMMAGHKYFISRAVPVSDGGVITDIYVNPRSHGRYFNNYTVRVSYTTMDGAERTTSLGEYASSMRIGQKIDLYYLPDSPWMVGTEGGHLLIAYICLGIGVVFILAGVVLFIRVRAF